MAHSQRDPTLCMLRRVNTHRGATTDLVTAPAATPSPFGLGRHAYAYLVAGGLAIAVYGLVGPSGPGDAIYIAIAASAVVALLAGIRRTRPVVRGAWRAVAATLVLMTLGNFLTVIARQEGLSELRNVADSMFMAAYLPLFFAAYRLGRGTHRSDRTVFLDTGIVGLAAVPLIWEAVVEPNLPEHIAGSAAVVALAIPLVDILLISLVAPLLLVRSSRTPSAFLLVSALAMTALGDTTYAVESLHAAAGQNPIANIAWLASYVLLAAAALTPSARDLGTARDPRHGAGDTPRLLVTAIALLATPLVMLHEALAEAVFDLALFAALSVAIASLIVMRLQRAMGELASVDRRFRRFMSHPGFLAVIKDAADRYVYMNPAAERALTTDDQDWYGRTDAELFPSDVARHRAQADAAARTVGASLVDTLDLDGRIWHRERFALPGSSGAVGILALDVTEQERAAGSMRFQARLLENVRDAVIVVDRAGVTRHWNKGAEEILGYSAEEMIGRTMQPLVAAQSDAQMAALWAGIQRGEIDSVDWRGIRADGSDVWLDVRVSPLLGDDGELSGFLGVCKDVTARKEAELELARLGAAIDHATDGVIITDGEDRVVYVNPAFERITGLAADDVLGSSIADIPEASLFARSLASARRDREHEWRGDIVGRRRDGSDLVCEATISPIVVDGQSRPGFVTIQRDVTRERAAERAAERRARERAFIAETISTLRASDSAEVTAAAVCSQMVKVPEIAIASLIAFGVGGIATVLGQVHRSGAGRPGLSLDASRSEYLRQRADAGPWVERWNVAPDHAYRQLFEELDIRANAYAPIVFEGRPIGVLVWGSDRRDSIERMTERLPALVELAAITATLLAGPVAVRNAEDAHRAALRSVIEARAFGPVFQPIVDLASGEIRGYEALTRFTDGATPDDHFELANRVGMGLELERACLQAAFGASTGLPQGAWLNVNVSPEFVLAGMVEEILPARDRDVVLEITEHQVISDYESFRQALEPMRDRVRLAVDDAGAGFSSLRHIVELAPAMVKLDRSLVAGIADDGAREAVVAGMVRFATNAGYTLLAEGVETQQELKTLRRLGVTLGQGYLFGRPVPVGPPADELVGGPRRRTPSSRTPRGSRRRAQVTTAAPAAA
jgi:PAS domain S-box-containing protein